MGFLAEEMALEKNNPKKDGKNMTLHTVLRCVQDT